MDSPANSILTKNTFWQIHMDKDWRWKKWKCTRPDNVSTKYCLKCPLYTLSELSDGPIKKWRRNRWRGILFWPQRKSLKLKIKVLLYPQGTKETVFWPTWLSSPSLFHSLTHRPHTHTHTHTDSQTQQESGCTPSMEFYLAARPISISKN